MVDNLLIVQHSKRTYHCGWLKDLENRKRRGLKEETILIRKKLSLLGGSGRKGKEGKVKEEQKVF